MFARRRIADKVRQLWSRGLFGKGIVVAVVFSACLAVGGTLLSLAHVTSSEFDGCGMSRAAMKARAEAMLQVLNAEYGQAKPFPGGDDHWVLGQEQFDIRYRTKIDPCDGYFQVRVPIAGPTPPPLAPNQMLEALENQNVGGYFERGVRSSFVYDEDVKRYYLAYDVPLMELRNGDIGSAVEERRSIGRAWRQGWFDAASQIATGKAPPPGEFIRRQEKTR